MAVLEVKNLSVRFDTPQGELQAVRDISFSLRAGEVLAIVGESGSGKSVLCRTLMGLLGSDARVRGSICAGGVELTACTERELERLRGGLLSMVFQNPMTALHPTLTVGQQIAEAVRRHEPGLSRAAVRQRVLSLLEQVELPEPTLRHDQYPHQLSGGMRQRVVLAIALAAEPRILLADEPTTALDVTVQAQILALLQRIGRQRDMATVLVAHDLGVVAQVADRVAVMYAGRIVEIGTAEEIFYESRHPYTWGLLRCRPALARRGEPLPTIGGTPPDLIDPPPGDAFACRNAYALAIDYEEAPPLFRISDTHYAATWLLDPRAPEITPPVTAITTPAALPQQLPAAQGSAPAEAPPEQKKKLGTILCYYGGKLLLFILSLWLLSAAVFCIARLAPGDPLVAYYGDRVEKMTVAERQEAQARLGLDDGLLTQYLRWLDGALRGEFGISLKYKTDVLALIGSRLPNTLLLGGIGFGLIFVLALLLGVLCARWEGSRLDRLVCRVGTLVSCVPEFWLSLVLLLIFAVGLRWLPSSGAYSVGGGGLGDRVLHLILPLTVVVTGHLWYYAYMIRSRLLNELQADYVQLARAKGLGTWHILFGHCLRVCLPAYLSLMAISVPHILGGTYIVETVFSYPGLGTLCYESARYQDYNLLMVLCLLSGAVVILANLAAQVLNERLDPRLREEVQGRG